LKVLGVIPARYGAKRFPGKPLALIAGRPLIQWVIEGARSARRLSQLLVATDHPEIAGVAHRLGVEAVMTAADLPSGSDRVWVAAQGRGADVLVNIQGDEPLIEGAVIDALVEPFFTDPDLGMATMGRPLNAEDVSNPQTVKVVTDRAGNALYFSRFGVPFSREPFASAPRAALKHIGIYAYRPNLLRQFCETPPTAIELCEGLEQLRALHLGARIRVIETAHEACGVDVPEDVARVAERLNKRGIP
jgi:3-deoxy-manno-octulosonate cytidylyltransferase (CMP-KDO synthetase)